jgi:hypothetical protein
MEMLEIGMLYTVNPINLIIVEDKDDMIFHKGINKACMHASHYKKPVIKAKLCLSEN